MVGSIPGPSFNGIHVGPFDIRVYGLMYVVAVLAAVAITARRWEAVGGSRALINDIALWAFPAGLVGGRLSFLATSWNEVPDHWWGPFAVWQGAWASGAASRWAPPSGCGARTARAPTCRC
jgi:prolipoprotein diacylglyceryltransferase